MRQLWNKIVAWVLSIPADKRLHFVCGLIIAAFFAIALDMKFCFWPVIFFAAVKEVFSTGRSSTGRTSRPPSWAPWFLSSSCCSIFGGSDLREPGLSERLRAPGAGESFGAPLSRF